MNNPKLIKKKQQLNKKSEINEKTRKLTRFLVQEMLYSFLSNKLNKTTHRAVEDFIDNSSEMKEKIKDMKFALSYCKKLSNGKISKVLLEEITNRKTFLKKCEIFISWRQWPKWAQWSLEASFLSLLVAFGVAVMISFFTFKESEFKNPETKENTNPGALKPSFSHQTQLSFLNEKKFKTNKGLPLRSNVPKFNDPKEIKHSSAIKNKISKKNLNQDSSYRKHKKNADLLIRTSQSNNPNRNTQKIKLKTTNQDSSKKSSVIKTETLSNSALGGLVYKAFMRLSNVTSVTPRIIKLIKDMEGQKAGRVKLGWIKKKGSYFHFSLPESRYNLFLEELKTYGSVLIQEEEHKRVMPKGKIRMILWIEKDSTNSSE